MENKYLSTAAAYIRVSTEDQMEFSPDSQRRRIEEYADRNRIKLLEQYIFIDEGISGRSADNRPAFLNMIRTAGQTPKPFDQILLWKFSRFARNRQDSIFYKSMLRREYGIDVGCNAAVRSFWGGQIGGVVGLCRAEDTYGANGSDECRYIYGEGFQFSCSLDGKVTKICPHCHIMLQSLCRCREF